MDNYRVNFYADDEWIDYPPKNFAEKFISKTKIFLGFRFSDNLKLFQFYFPKTDIKI